MIMLSLNLITVMITFWVIVLFPVVIINIIRSLMK